VTRAAARSGADEVTLVGLSRERPESVAEVNEAREHLLVAIRRLPRAAATAYLEIHRADVERRDRQDHGAKRGAIKSLYHRTLLALRDELGLEALSVEGRTPTIRM
jgi:hypothetical protein